MRCWSLWDFCSAYIPLLLIEFDRLFVWNCKVYGTPGPGYPISTCIVYLETLLNMRVLHNMILVPEQTCWKRINAIAWNQYIAFKVVTWYFSERGLARNKLAGKFWTFTFTLTDVNLWLRGMDREFIARTFLEDMQNPTYCTPQGVFSIWRGALILNVILIKVVSVYRLVACTHVATRDSK